MLIAKSVRRHLFSTFSFNQNGPVEITNMFQEAYKYAFFFYTVTIYYVECQNITI